MKPKNENFKIDLSWTFMCVLIALVVMALTAVAVKLMNIKSAALIIGVVLMLITIPVHIYAKRNNNFYYLCYAINSIASGFSIGALYTIKDLRLPLTHAALALAVTTAILVLAYFLIGAEISFSKPVVLIVAIIAFGGTALFALMNPEEAFYSMAFLLLVHVGAYIFMFDSLRYEPLFARQLSRFSYGIYIVITVIVLVIVSEGDIGLDFGTGSGKKNKQKQPMSGQ